MVRSNHTGGGMSGRVTMTVKMTWPLSILTRWVKTSTRPNFDPLLFTSAVSPSGTISHEGQIRITAKNQMPRLTLHAAGHVTMSQCVSMCDSECVR